jgi:hypothetical protein
MKVWPSTPCRLVATASDLLVRLLGELWGSDVGNPDLDGPQPLLAESLSVRAYANGGG